MSKQKKLIFTGIFIFLFILLGRANLYAQRGFSGSNSDYQSWGQPLNGPSNSSRNSNNYGQSHGGYSYTPQPVEQPKTNLSSNSYPSPGWTPSNNSKEEFRVDKSSSPAQTSNNKTQGSIHITIINEPEHEKQGNGDRNFSEAVKQAGNKSIVLMENERSGWVNHSGLAPLEGVMGVAGLDEPQAYQKTLDTLSEKNRAAKELQTVTEKAKALAQKSEELGKERAALQALKTETDVKWLTASEEFLQIGEQWNNMQTQAKLDYETTLAKYTTAVNAFNEVVKKYNSEAFEAKTLFNTSLEKFKTAESFYNQAQKQREDKWIETIASAKGMNYDTVILIVGAAHGANKFGLLDKLNEQGYSWTSLMPKGLDLSRFDK